MAEVKWIKITTNVFDDEKIKLIDTMPDRDAMLVIWFKILALAGKTNDGGALYIIKKMPMTDEMLATVFNRPLNTVRLALQTFVDFGMVEIDKHVNVVNWDKHQNIEGMDKIREQNRKRQEKFRENKKIIALENKSNVTSRDSNAIDKNKNKKENNNNTAIISLLEKFNLKVEVDTLLQHANDDTDLIIKQINNYHDKGVAYLIKAIQDKYEKEVPKIKRGVNEPPKYGTL